MGRLPVHWLIYSNVCGLAQRKLAISIQVLSKMCLGFVLEISMAMISRMLKNS